MLPRKRDDFESIFIAPNHFAYRDNYQILVESTGHPFRDGRRVGEDKFYTFNSVERPGLGRMRSFDYNQTWTPEGVPLSSHSWRLGLCRFYSIGAGHTNSGIDDTGLPEPSIAPFSDFTLALNGYGTKFVRSARPGNPLAALGQFAGELHDLPRIPVFKRRAKFFRELGNEYLNLAFGWKPFVTDLIKAYKLSVILDARLSQLVKDNGLLIRRRRRLEFSSTNDVLCDIDLDDPFNWAFGVNGQHLDDVPHPLDDDFSCFKVTNFRGANNTGESTFDSASGHFKLERKTQLVVMGSGNFRYYVPDIGSLRWTEKARSKLYDAELTPSILWELYPWSWLTDWFTNVGDIVSNLSSNAVDRETLDNCFVTYHKVVTYTGTLSVKWDSYTDLSSGISIPADSETLTWSKVDTWKLRQPASPFGFGIDSSAFTLAQEAIFAALAVSRQRRF